MIDHKRFAAEAFSRANRMDRRVWGKPGARIGLVAAGKNWLDLQHALSLLGIDANEAERLGITTYKVGQPWPLDMASFHDWAEGLDLVIAVEEKRKLIEVQIKEALFDDRHGRRVYGWHKGDEHSEGRREEIFPTRYALDPIYIAEKLGGLLIEEGRRTDRIEAGLARLADARGADNAEEIAARLPYFCSGCPHNSSTKVPEGHRAYAGIGCHYMVQWMDRETVGFTQMGGEGANWIGEAPFSTRNHVFQNLGDGTYNHSGVQSIRAALAAGTNITFKILYNDAVAMTGGQPVDGDLSVEKMVYQLRGEGIKRIAVVSDNPDQFSHDFSTAFIKEFKGLSIHHRDQLEAVQLELREILGTSVLIYVQTCAAEKRRRRKKGVMEDPAKRVFINELVCEGCGDCGVQSNCLSVIPKDTVLGRKRMIDQSACNKDYSCVKGFCPSFVTVHGGQLKKNTAMADEDDWPELPLPTLPTIDVPYNIMVAGIGGTGVLTVGSVLGMAAHIAEKGTSVLTQTGLAQKFGSVTSHVRIAN
ncbi:hypothetical protein LCGC14_2394570, partial [marine sediment metagenome]